MRLLSALLLLLAVALAALTRAADVATTPRVEARLVSETTGVPAAGGSEKEQCSGGTRGGHECSQCETRAVSCCSARLIVQRAPQLVAIFLSVSRFARAPALGSAAGADALTSLSSR